MSLMIAVDDLESYLHPNLFRPSVVWRSNRSGMSGLAEAFHLLQAQVPRRPKLCAVLPPRPAVTEEPAPMPTPEKAKPALLTAEETAARLGIRVRSLHHYRRENVGPKLKYRIDRKTGVVMYVAASVEAEVERRAGRVGGAKVRLTTAEAAARLGVSEYALRMKRHRGQHALPWQQDGRRIWYRVEDVERYRAQAHAVVEGEQGGDA